MVCLSALVLLASAAEITHAQGEHGRRAGAELRVLIGDVRQLGEYALTGTEPVLQRGLKDRIRGSLSAMDILLRLADQENGYDNKGYKSFVQTALLLANDNKWVELDASLSTLEERFPLLQPTYPKSKVLLKSSYKLHKSLCASCHDTPAQGAERPAYNLYQQSKSMPDIEFYGRMLIGVRGDRVTGIDNPFSDVEIAGLIHLYKSKNNE